MSTSDISSTSDFVMPNEPVVQKRVYEGNKYGEPPAKKWMPSIRVASGFQWNLQALAQAADAVESGAKSPVSALNELGVKVSYSVVRQGGPAHCPSFDVTVHVADMKFEGWGHSKREARAAAARACLTALLTRAGRVLHSGDHHTDFTKDVLPVNTEPEIHSSTNIQSNSKTQIREVKIEKSTTEIKPEPVSQAPSPSDVSPSAALFGALSPTASFSKSPINLLYENYPGLNFTCTFGDGSPLNGPQAPLQLSHSMRFKVVCQIKDQIYEGYGSSKKLAKLAAARAALAVLDSGRAEPRASAPTPHGALPQALADHIAKIVNEKFNELMKHDLVHSKRKVLAGIVITDGDNIEGARILAVTTGTKCVSGEHMSVRGRAVNDCHAEVAARRCLQRHLYSQLLQYAQQSDPTKPLASNDLEPIPGGGYQLKPRLHLHLYVSTAPCGDSRIFSPHEHREAPDPHPNRQARGQLRTKIESGEGTIPVKNSNYIQTWDGVMQGERLLTMSCSDKVARWCVVGVQGALLSRVLRPVYLHSLVLGSLLHTHHMYRALCGRIENHIPALPHPYRLHRCLLARAASTEARTPARAPSFSVCWSSTTAQPEILNAMTGKLENGQPSLLCKQTMFARWQHLITKLKHLPQSAALESELPPLPENRTDILYSEAKMLCPGYQAAKKCLFEAFESAKLGRWIKKPLEQDEFCCEINDADPKHLFAWVGDDLTYNTMQESRSYAGIKHEYGRENIKYEYVRKNIKHEYGRENIDHEYGRENIKHEYGRENIEHEYGRENIKHEYVRENTKLENGRNDETGEDSLEICKDIEKFENESDGICKVKYEIGDIGDDETFYSVIGNGIDRKMYHYQDFQKYNDENGEIYNVNYERSDVSDEIDVNHVIGNCVERKNNHYKDFEKFNDESGEISTENDETGDVQDYNKVYGVIGNIAERKKYYYKDFVSNCFNSYKGKNTDECESEVGNRKYRNIGGNLCTNKSNSVDFGQNNDEELIKSYETSEDESNSKDNSETYNINAKTSEAYNMDKNENIIINKSPKLQNRHGFVDRTLIVSSEKQNGSNKGNTLTSKFLSRQLEIFQAIKNSNLLDNPPETRPDNLTAANTNDVVKGKTPFSSSTNVSITKEKDKKSRVNSEIVETFFTLRKTLIRKT